MAIPFECPVCEFQGKVGDDQQGKEMVCKGCGHKWVLAGATADSHSGAATVTATATATATAKPAAGELIAAQCPACKTKGKVPLSARGKKVKCPKCSEMFVVGQILQPAAPPAGPASRLSDAGDPPPPEEAAAYVPPPSKALDEVKAPADVGITPLEGAEVVDDEDKAPVYDLVDDAAIVIDTVCPGCKHKGNVPEKFAGKKVKCPRCSAMFVVGGSRPPAAAKPPAAAAPAADNPFAGMAAPGAAAIKKAADTQQIPADANPFAFAEETPPGAPSQPVATEKKSSGSGVRPGPAKNKVERQLQDEEARVNQTMFWVAGGIIAVAFLVGGVVLLRLMNAPAAKDTGAVAVVRPPEENPAPEAPNPRGKVSPTEANATPIPPPPGDVKPPEPPAQPVAVPVPQPPRKEVTYVGASRESAQQGDIRVRITAAWIDFPKGPAGVAPKKFLLLQLQIENQSAGKQTPYVGWNVTPAAPGKSAPAGLIDPLGKELKLATQKETIIKVPGQLASEVIMPGQTLDDLLVFEAPAGKTPEYLRLHLPAENLGGQGVLGMEIPGSMVVGSATTRDPLVKNPDPGMPPDKSLAEKLATLRQTARKGLPAQRENAVKTLGMLGADAGPAVPDLMYLVREDKNEMVRAAAAEALGKIGAPAKIAINTLILALRDEFWRVKANACEALAAFGPDAKEAIPHLKKLMQSKEDEVPTKAALALSKIDTQTRGKALPKVPPPKGLPPPPKAGPPPGAQQALPRAQN